ncbi:MAG: hypothetical protein GQE15_40250 [Archangiaceae bacterium]|nr:hypothetical protein [Archangiaceae bacterium]
MTALSLLTVLVLSQRTTLLSDGPRVPLAKAVTVLASPKPKWDQRSSALEALEGHVFSEAEVATLKKAVLSLPRVTGGRCAKERAPGCGVSIDDCLSPAGYVLATVEGSAAAAQFVDAAVLMLDDGKDPGAIPLARRVLANAKHPRAEVEARKLIVSTDCVGEGARMLASVPTLSLESKAAVELALAQGAIDGHALGGLIAQRQEDWAVALLPKVFSHPTTDLRRGAVRGCATKFPSSERARAAFAQVARCDPAWPLRDEAKAIFKAAKVPLPELVCPAPKYFANGRVVKGPTGTVTLTESSTVAPPSEACLKAVGKEASVKALGTVGDTCILGANFGEFGGALFRWRETGPENLSGRDGFLNPIALVARGREVLVVSGVHHMMGSGALGRISRDDGATFVYERLMRFEAVPVAWAVDGERLVMSFEATEFSSPCRNAKAEATFIYEADGSFSVAQSPATACLWPAVK